MKALCAYRTMVPVRVLVVEDEPVLADSIAKGLRRRSFAVDVVYDGQAAIEAIADASYDVAILDRDLPKVHGDVVCKQIAQYHPGVRVLMLTASSEITSRVHGLDLGADDYLAKPFAFAELVARVNALMRRSVPASPPLLTYADLTLDQARVRTSRAGNPVSLSKKEFTVLFELMRSPETVVSAEQLLERAWDANIDPFTNVVRVTMMTLRRKLGDPPLIQTVTGMGYCLTKKPFDSERR